LAFAPFPTNPCRSDDPTSAGGSQSASTQCRSVPHGSTCDHCTETTAHQRKETGGTIPPKHSTVELALYQRPEVLYSVRLNCAARVLNGVFCDLMGEVGRKALLGIQGVRTMRSPRQPSRAHGGAVRSCGEREPQTVRAVLRALPPMSDSSTSTSPASLVAVSSCIASRTR
jgi:hypothetical protein